MKEFFRQQIEKITTLTDSEFDYIFSHFTKKKFKKHQFVIREEDYVPNDFFVVTGCLKAYFIDGNGKEHILQFGMPDWWITDYNAYYNQSKATINLDCIEDSELLCLSLQNREKLCSEFQKIEHFFRKKASRHIITLHKRVLSLLSSSAKERYDQLLQLYPELFQKVPKQLIASYLGVTRETLSRLNSTTK